MANFLAVDTSGSYLTVVAYKNGQAHTVFLPDCAMKHSVSVMPAIDEVLKQADMSLDECDFFGSVVGAGSFTGIRIGISVVKGLCLAYGKPALPITSFDVMAYTKKDDKVLCLVDALHGAYYACGYDGGKVSYAPAYLMEDEVLALQSDGYDLLSTATTPIAEKANLTIVDPVAGLANAVEYLSAKNAFGPLTALYVRKSSAELNLEEKK